MLSGGFLKKQPADRATVRLSRHPPALGVLHARQNFFRVVGLQSQCRAQQQFAFLQMMCDDSSIGLLLPGISTTRPSRATLTVSVTVPISWP